MTIKLRHLPYRQARPFLAVILLLASFIPSHLVAHASGSGHFGIDEGYQSSTAFSQSGASWDRVNFFWNSYQPTGPTEWLGNANL